MLVLPLSPTDQATPRQPQRRRRGSIVWQPHYEGFATIAYQDGKAAAGISGPWSGQYVLIWWTHAQPIREVELFDSLEDAKQLVAERLAPDSGKQFHGLLGGSRQPSAAGSPSWLRRLGRHMLGLFGRSATARLVDHRRRLAGEETDLRGINIRAVR